MTVEDHEFRLAGFRDVWRLAFVHGLAFAPRRAPSWLRGLIAVLRYPASVVMLTGRQKAADLYTTGADELVIITDNSLGIPLAFLAQIPGALVVAASLPFAYAGLLTPTLASLSLGILVLAADLAYFIVPAFILKLPQAQIEQKRALGDEPGFRILSAGRAWSSREGTLERVRALIMGRPDLQPCYAIAKNENLAQRYGKVMTVIGTSGWAFRASGERPQGHESDTEGR